MIRPMIKTSGTGEPYKPDFKLAGPCVCFFLPRSVVHCRMQSSPSHASPGDIFDHAGGLLEWRHTHLHNSSVERDINHCILSWADRSIIGDFQ